MTEQLTPHLVKTAMASVLIGVATGGFAYRLVQDQLDALAELGLALVPVEATPQMRKAMHEAMRLEFRYAGWAKAWKYAVEAAPKLMEDK